MTATGERQNTAQLSPTAHPTLGTRPTAATLFEATMELEAVIAAMPSITDWLTDLHRAIQACTLSVEHELDDIQSADGKWEEIARDEPRLIPQIERLKGMLNGVLVGLWEANGQSVGRNSELGGALRDLASAMRRSARRDVDLFYEWLVPVGGED